MKLEKVLLDVLFQSTTRQSHFQNVKFSLKSVQSPEGFRNVQRVVKRKNRLWDQGVGW